MNRTNIIGRLTKDPELKYTSTGKAVLNFTVAVNKTFGDQGADFITCQAWNKTAEAIANNLRKGSKVGVDGRLSTRSYESDGRKVFVMEVVAESVEFLDGKNSQQQAPQQGYYQQAPVQQVNTYQAQQSNYGALAGEGNPIDISEDDLPFD